MELHYTVIDPTGNITLLVTSPVERSLQPRVAGALLGREPGSEQVGFLESSDACQARLQMMGGEFCGNASMSLGAWLCRQEGLPWGETRDLTLEVSGVDAPVACSVTPVRSVYLGTVSMPLPQRIEYRTFRVDEGSCSLPVVFLPGICHIIAPVGTVRRTRAESLLRRWAASLPCQAAGLMLLDEGRMAFDPLVYVADTDTAVWEHGCGSGSAAVGAYLTCRRQAGQCLSLRQPGGVMAVVTTWDGFSLSGLTISGTVKLGEDKTAEITI